MKLEKRNEGGPVEPEEDMTPKGKKTVVVYIMVLFIAAFLLMAWSFASHQRSNTEAIGQLQSSVTAMQGVQDLQNRVISLQDELEEAQEEIRKLEQEANLLELEREAGNRQYAALARLYSLERSYSAENLEACRKIIDGMEEDGLAICLNSNPSNLEQEPGIIVSAQDRYQQLKEAVETREAEAQETDGAAS